MHRSSSAAAVAVVSEAADSAARRIEDSAVTVATGAASRSYSSGTSLFHVFIDNFKRFRGFCNFTKTEVERLRFLKELYVANLLDSEGDSDDFFVGTYLETDEAGKPILGSKQTRIKIPQDMIIDSPLVTIFNAALSVFSDYVRERMQSQAVTHDNDIEYLFSMFVANEFVKVIALGTSKRQLNTLSCWKRFISAVLRSADNPDKNKCIFTRTEVGDRDLTLYTTLNSFCLYVDWMKRVVEFELSRRTIADELKTVVQKGRESYRLLIEVLIRFVADKQIPDSATVVVLNSPNLVRKYRQLFMGSYLLRRVFDEATSPCAKALMQCDAMRGHSSTRALEPDDAQDQSVLSLKPEQSVTERFLNGAGETNIALLDHLRTSKTVSYEGDNLPLGLTPVYSNSSEVLELYMQTLGWLQIISEQLAACEEAKQLFSVGGEILTQRHASQSMRLLVDSLEGVIEKLLQLTKSIEQITEQEWRKHRQQGWATDKEAHAIWSANHEVMQRKLDFLKEYLGEMSDAVLLISSRMRNIEPITDAFKSRLANFMAAMGQFAARYQKLMPSEHYRRFMLDNNKQLRSLLRNGLEAPSASSGHRAAIEYGRAQVRAPLPESGAGIETNFVLSQAEFTHHDLGSLHQRLNFSEQDSVKVLDVKVIKRRYIYVMLQSDFGKGSSKLIFARLDRLARKKPVLSEPCNLRGKSYKPRFQILKDNVHWFYSSIKSVPYTYPEGQLYLNSKSEKCVIVDFSVLNSEGQAKLLIKRTPWYDARILENENLVHLVNGYELKSGKKVRHPSGYLITKGPWHVVSSMSTFFPSYSSSGQAKDVRFAQFSKSFRRSIRQVFGCSVQGLVYARDAEGSLVTLDTTNKTFSRSVSSLLVDRVTAHTVLAGDLHVVADTQRLHFMRGTEVIYQRPVLSPEVFQAKRIVPLTPLCFAVKYVRRTSGKINAEASDQGGNAGKAEEADGAQAVLSNVDHVALGDDIVIELYHLACKAPIFTIRECVDITRIDDMRLLLVHADNKISTLQLPSRVLMPELSKSVLTGTNFSRLVRLLPDNVLPLYQASGDSSFLLAQNIDSGASVALAHCSVSDMVIALQKIRQSCLNYTFDGVASLHDTTQYHAGRSNVDHIFLASPYSIAEFAQNFLEDIRIMTGARGGTDEWASGEWSHMPTSLVCALYVSGLWYAIRIQIDYTRRTASILWDAPFGPRELPAIWQDHIQEVVARGVSELIAKQCDDELFRFELHALRQYTKPFTQHSSGSHSAQNSAHIVCSNIEDYVRQYQRLSSEFCANSRRYFAPIEPLDSSEHNENSPQGKFEASFEPTQLRGFSLDPLVINRVTRTHRLRSAAQSTFEASDLSDELRVSNPVEWAIFYDGVAHHRLTHPNAGDADEFSLDELEAGIEAVKLSRQSNQRFELTRIGFDREA